jgi:hypothetical protein
MTLSSLNLLNKMRPVRTCSAKCELIAAAHSTRQPIPNLLSLLNRRKTYGIEK